MRVKKQIKPLFLIFSLSIIMTALSAQHNMHTMPVSNGSSNRIELIDNIGGIHHPVSTKIVEAQKYFNQGLALIYAYNTEDAMRSFQAANDLDPQMAMAYWGMALANNADASAYEISEEKKIKIYNCLQKAMELPASEKDLAFIQALSKKFSPDTSIHPLTSNIAFMQAMKELYSRYPDDADAGAMYAASIYKQKQQSGRPWLERWNRNHDFTAEGAAAAAVLAALIKKFPDHLGANHYYIHVIEGSHHPELALASCKKLEQLKLDNIRFGHLIHMPTHIYLPTGNYEMAAKSDEAVMNKFDSTLSGNLQGFIFGHSLDFLYYTYKMQGRYNDFYLMFQNYASYPPFTDQEMQETIFDAEVLVRFRKWSQIINAPEPNTFEKMWAKAMASAATGLTDKAQFFFRKFSEKMDTVIAAIASDNEVYLGNMQAKKILYESLVMATIARSKSDYKQAAKILRLATDTEDRLYYTEPPLWSMPVRESLGAVLILDKNYKEAEKVFRDELKKRPNNPRALFGLGISLELQKRKNEAAVVKNQFKQQWKWADTELSIEEL